MNTLFYTGIGTVLNVFHTTLGAFALSYKKAFWRNYIMIFVVFTMFFSGGLIPSYLLVTKLGMNDTRWALIIPEAISVWNMIIMKTFFESLPDSLKESAKIDGANDIVILFRIIVPLSTPVIAVMFLFYGVSHWNSWFSAMVYIRNRDLYPLQLILREILIANDTSTMTGAGSIGDFEQIGLTIRYATVMVATVPILMIYPFLQKYFVKGIMIGAIKG
jgi:putative aldouronate transport system permease protein